ncbi:MAG: hypothetical protein A2452_04645 [Candidatus Firestonebacteria bacterium RIFOXYC2_FULL_39_67]|nr:MAG: hypothetical protein A2536_11615 [Candidatus Firestonebacteria bacterium RIFOXYD2_FULL_39_29]OGF53149.1 MAG: hypothetical protein A2497_09300 [Candidatus Firestonebacteria bacterium RifOxyC12_full_39_7]OGF55875.1 MAG: hypothetical protein A2452_04645 [Candidatus Firestonebacteria bacterium RIFOXYC2_FULL_39_67]
MKISAVIVMKDKTENIERCLKTIYGWTSEIIMVTSSSSKIKRKIMKKYEVKVLIFDDNREKMIQKGIKTSKADWVVVLNADEEISIPLKIEMRTKLSGVIQDRVKVKIVKNYKDIWIPESDLETRIYKRYVWQKGNESAVFSGSIRKYSQAEFPLKPVLKKMDIRKILVIKLRGIGDTVLMTPLLANLKRYYKDAAITCAVYPANREIIKNNPNIKAIITFDGIFDAFFKIFKAGKFDLVLCPQASLRTALLAAASGADYKVVNNHNGKNYFSSFRVRKPEEYEDAIDRDLDCLRAIGIPVKTRKVEVKLLKNELINIRKFGFSIRDKIIGINVSASRQNKMWFKERFADLADKLIKERFKIIFIEDPQNPEALEQVIKLMKNKPFTICERNLRKVMALLSGFNLFIGNDSGLLHAAVALGVPSISIVGPEESQIFNPYNSKDKHYTLSADVNCKPCWKNDCNMPLCLDAITVNQVLQVVLKAVK